MVLLTNGLLANFNTGLAADLAAGLAAALGAAVAAAAVAAALGADGFFAAAGFAAGLVTFDVEDAVAGFFSEEEPAFFSAFFSAGLPVLH